MMTKREKIVIAAIVLLVLLALVVTCSRADDTRHESKHRRRADTSENYVISRQRDYQVPSGSQPSDRIIVGRREIDVYSDGSMFEGDHMVGVRH